MTSPFPLLRHAIAALAISMSGAGYVQAQQRGAETWADAAPMVEARQELYPVVVDGRIYVAGGIRNPNTDYSDGFEAYDPQADAWTALTALPDARHHVTLSSVDGKIYAVGGFSGGFPDWRAESTVWIYDLAHASWSPGVNLPRARAEGVAAAVGGKVYVIGGRIRIADAASHFNDHVDSDLNSAFDPTTGQWVARAPAPTARNSAAVAVIDGKIYVVGGRQFQRNSTPGPIRQVNVAALEVYDPFTNRWETRAPMPSAQAGLGAASVDGKLYACGGEQLPVRLFRECWVYTPVTDRWSPAPELPVARHGIGMAAVGRRIHVFGGALTPGGNAATSMHQVLDLR